MQAVVVMLGILLGIGVIVYILYILTRRELLTVREMYQELLHDHRSIQVKHGMSFEQLFPFMENYPYNPRHFRFIGTPVDGISFEEDKVVFVEFKTGNAQLSPLQTKIKNLIQQKQVEWKEVREVNK